MTTPENSNFNRIFESGELVIFNSKKISFEYFSSAVLEKYLVFFLLVCVNFSCLGCSSSLSNSDQNNNAGDSITNQAPLANTTGTLDSVIIGKTVTLIGSSSTDPDMASCSGNKSKWVWSWSLTSVPADSSLSIGSTNITNANQSSALFTPDIMGTYEVSLTLTDDAGLCSGGNLSNTATVTINVIAAPDNQAPALDTTGSTTTVVIGNNAVLTGASSSDEDMILCEGKSENWIWSWSIVSVPGGSSIAIGSSSISNSDQSIASFTPDIVGTYSVQLNLTDDAGLCTGGNLSSSEDISISVITPPPNQAPSASALGSTDSIIIGNTANLIGTSSSDSDMILCGGDSANWAWSWSLTSVPGGSGLSLGSANITNANSSSASFLPDVDGTYQVQLTLTDDAGLCTGGNLDNSVNWSVTVVTGPANQAPVAGTLGTPSQVALGVTVTLESYNSTDPDISICEGNNLNWLWSWIINSVPGGSSLSVGTASITNANQKSATFLPDVVGIYSLSLTITDDAGICTGGNQNNTIDFTVDAIDPPVNQAPIAKTDGSDTFGNPGDTINLKGNTSGDIDFYICGGQISNLVWAWSLTSVPIGSSLSTGSTNIINSISVSASFVPDIIGTYQAQLTLTDDAGVCTGGNLSDSTTVDINISNDTIYNIGTYACTPDDASDTRLHLYASDGVTLLGSDDDNGLGWYSLIRYPLVSGTTYYIMNENTYWDVTGCYYLEISASALPASGPSTKSDDTGDIFPNKASADAAGSLLIDVETIHYDNNATGGEDWFRIVVP